MESDTRLCGFMHDYSYRKPKCERKSILEGETVLLSDSCYVHRLFEETLAKDGGVFTGLYYQQRFVPYVELNRRANIAARCLKRRVLNYHGTESLSGDVVIGVDIEPCDGLIVVLLAIMKIGATYVPLDSKSAINRVRYVLNEAQPACIIVDSNSMFKFETDTMWSSFFIMDVDMILNPPKDWTLSSSNLTTDDMLVSSKLICIIYTSGSTGKPKGVCLSHLTTLNRINWQWDQFPLFNKEKGCFKTSLLFVDSIVEIFANIVRLVNMTIVPREVTKNPEQFITLLEAEEVTRLVMVPSMLRNILFYLSIAGSNDRLSHLKLWICNSETLPPDLLHTFFAMFPCGKLFANFYGSTETMADVTYETFKSTSDINLKSYENNLSIGVPMYNNTIYIVDGAGELVSQSDVGEICVSGLNVADGYLDNISTPAFIPNPHSKDKYHSVLYKTGDFGRIINGRIIYEGRRDLQVKIRGQRVNISEIEAVVRECPFVDKTVVLCHKFSEIYTVIVAYYTTASKKRETKLDSTIADMCKKSLPEYMRPRPLHIEEIPLQSHTGKVDRVALREIFEKAYNRQSSEELSVVDETTRKALHIIAMNLNLPTNAIPSDASFFELGGNSVSMIATIVQLREYGLHIPIELFSSAQSVQEIVDHVTESQEPIGETLRTDKYTVQPLHEVENNTVIIDILAESFVEKEPLDVLLGVTKPEFLPFAQSLYKASENSPLSIAVLDRRTGRIVGGDFLYDFSVPLEIHKHESMAPIFSLIEEFERPVRQHLLQTANCRLMVNFCLCVDKDLPHADQVKMCHLIEGTVLRVARAHGFGGVVTTNTNPVTQDICEHFFDYQLLDKIHVKDYNFKGQQVFSHAPEDFYIKMMIKYL